MYSRYVVRLCLLGYIHVISVVTTTLFVTKEGLVKSLNAILPRVSSTGSSTMVMTVAVIMYDFLRLTKNMLENAVMERPMSTSCRACYHSTFSSSHLQTTLGVLATSNTRSSHAQSRPSAFISALSSPYPHPPRSPPPTSHQTLSARALPQSPEHHVP